MLTLSRDCEPAYHLVDPVTMNNKGFLGSLAHPTTRYDWSCSFSLGQVVGSCLSGNSRIADT